MKFTSGVRPRRQRSRCLRSLFTRSDALKRHERKHLEMITHTCGNCLKNFYHNEMLLEHEIFCQETTRKRKLEEVGDIPTQKKQRVAVQTGVGETPQEDDDNPCELISAFKESLKKVQLKP